MSTDAIVLLKEDHARVRKLLAQFQEAGKAATKTEEAIVDKILEELTVHTYLENEVMYPRVQQLLPALEDDVL
jgi:hemerythrin superfamily protein